MALTLDGTAGLTLPTWTTAGRPSNPTAGQFGYNSTLGYIEWYSTSASLWLPIYSAPLYQIDYLVVAGGGAAGNYGGGGGAGGYISAAGVYLTPGSLYTVTIGAGGTGAVIASDRKSTRLNSSH